MASGSWRCAEPAFLKVYTGHLEALAADQSVPAYLRAHYLAMARAEPNGHAEFPRGVLAKLLGKNGKRHHDVESAIQKAVAFRLLDADSMPTCLVLPDGLAAPHDRTGRAKRLPCRTHGGAPRPVRTADCHPNSKHKAHGLCQSCYKAEARLAEAMGREPRWVSPSAPLEPA